MRILVLPGTDQPQMIVGRLQEVVGRARRGDEVLASRPLSDLPPYSPGAPLHGAPAEVESLREQVATADVVVVWAHGYDGSSPVLENAMAWLAGGEQEPVLQGKHVFVVAKGGFASWRDASAVEQLEAMATAAGAAVMPSQWSTMTLGADNPELPDPYYYNVERYVADLALTLQVLDPRQVTITRAADLQEGMWALPSPSATRRQSTVPSGNVVWRQVKDVVPSHGYGDIYEVLWRNGGAYGDLYVDDEAVPAMQRGQDPNVRPDPDPQSVALAGDLARALAALRRAHPEDPFRYARPDPRREVFETSGNQSLAFAHRYAVRVGARLVVSVGGKELHAPKFFGDTRDPQVHPLESYLFGDAAGASFAPLPELLSAAAHAGVPLRVQIAPHSRSWAQHAAQWERTVGQAQPSLSAGVPARSPRRSAASPTQPGQVPGGPAV